MGLFTRRLFALILTVALVWAPLGAQEKKGEPLLGFSEEGAAKQRRL